MIPTHRFTVTAGHVPPWRITVALRARPFTATRSDGHTQNDEFGRGKTCYSFYRSIRCCFYAILKAFLARSRFQNWRRLAHCTNARTEGCPLEISIYRAAKRAASERKSALQIRSPLGDRQRRLDAPSDSWLRLRFPNRWTGSYSGAIGP